MSDLDLGEGYAHEHRPLRGYSTLTTAYAIAFAGSLYAAHREGHELPARIGPWDVATVGIATHKLARTITKEKVTSSLRAPFVRFQERSGHGELEEEPRGSGLRLAVGELLVCPYCMSQWVASGFAVGLVAAPRLTRLIAFIFSAETVADFLQLAYKAAEERAAT